MWMLFTLFLMQLVGGQVGLLALFAGSVHAGHHLWGFHDGEGALGTRGWGGGSRGPSSAPAEPTLPHVLNNYLGEKWLRNC